MNTYKKSLILTSFCAFVLFLFFLCPESNAAQPRWTLNDTYAGFKLVEQKKVPEINANAYLFAHEKSGARLLYIENTDDNKVFSISFRTLPADSTGVAHILEHSVLCGSRKFPVKEPFVDMLKSSLNTFLNAMTFPDKTVFPVASRNDKDFRNLMDVYMDAVFYPNIYQKPEIFSQEGWHYELKDAGKDLLYNGVVYNEMKGVFSSPESLLWRAIPKSLLPDTIYTHSSGGDPETIPNLSREQFLDFHHTYYHPANSYIFLYGNLDILDTLKFLDHEYLRAFDKKEFNYEIALQTALPPNSDVKINYPVAANEKITNKTYLTLNYVIGQAGELDLLDDFSILDTVLLGSDDAPLKRAIIDAGIGQNVYSSFDIALKQPTYSIVVTNANEEQKAKLEQLVHDKLTELVNKGIDKKLIKSAYSIAEFQKRDLIANAKNKGLTYSFASLTNWVYDKDPIAPLAYHSISKHKAVTTPYFETIIKRYLLDNPLHSTVIAVPEPGLEEIKAAETKAKLANYKASLSTEENAALVNQTNELKAEQTAPDAPENIAKMPTLSPTDISPRAEKIDYEEMNEAGTTVLYTPQFTNGITYFNLNFSTKTVSQEELPYLYLLAELLGEIDTEKYTQEDLSNKIKIKTGGISFSVNAVADKAKEDIYHPYLAVTTKALVSNIPAALELVNQIINHSKFDNPDRLLELIKKIKAERQSELLQGGTKISINRAMSYISPAYSYRAANDLPFYQFISGLEKDYTAKAPEVRRHLSALRDKVFNKKDLLTNVVASREDYQLFQPHLKKFINTLQDKSLEPAAYPFVVNPKNEGLITAGKVQYVTKVFNFRSIGYDYTGKMRVLQTILNTNYLWNHVRVLGGAYGGSIGIDRAGTLFFTSWRDPNLMETLAIYDEVASFLSNFSATEREMNNYIIATIGKLDTPLTPYGKGDSVTRNYMRGITYADIQQERDDVLTTTPEDIRNFAKMFTELKQQNYFCVVGNESKLKENQAHFGALLPLTE
ncbi:MAG: insulinase family protein [Pelosinus sp.]|nr:insulinase family protein [Pelosinus sp.]